jgi:hypothetical protein
MAEKKVIELEIKTESLGSLKSQLRQAQAEVAELSAKFGATSQEAINAAKRAAELKDAIGDAKALTDAYNPDAKFNALSQSIGGVLNGFQAFEGALGLVGVQSKDVEEALLAVNSAMALSQGVTGVLESVDSFKTLATQVSNLTIVQKISTAAQWLWNAAMAANPIGAIIVAITALIVAGYKLISWFNESADAADKANASMDRHTKALEKQEKQLERSSKNLKDTNKYQYDYAKAAGASSEQLRKLAIEHQKEELALAKKNLELAKSTYLREQDILASYRANDASEELIKRQTEIVKKAREATTKARESLTQEYDDLKALRLQQKVEIRQEETDANKEAQARAKEAADAAKERHKEYLEKQKEQQKAREESLKKIKDAEKEYQNSLLTQQQRELNDATNKYDELIKLAIKNKQDTAILEEAKQKTISDINSKYAKLELEEKAKLEEAKKALEAKQIADMKSADEAAWNEEKARMDLRTKYISDDKTREIQEREDTYQKELVDLQNAYDNKLLTDEEYQNATKLATEKNNQDKIEIEKKYLDKSKQINQQRIDLVLKYAQTFGNAMGSLTNLLNVQDNERLKNVKKGSKEEEAIKKKMFERDKKLRIVQTVIDTASNIVQSVRNGGGIPTGIPFGVAAGVMGALQIAAIKKTSFDAGGGEQPPASGGSQSSGAGTSNVITPNFNVVGNAQATNPLAGLGAQPIQAYVVSGEVTTAQSLDRNRVNYATFG